jgi:hypothetical protein
MSTATGPRAGEYSALNSRQVREVRQLHADGVAPRHLAARFHCSKRTIHRALKADYITHDAGTVPLEPADPCHAEGGHDV